MFPSLRSYNAEAGPSRPAPLPLPPRAPTGPPRLARNVERTYTGPDRGSLPAQMSAAEAERHYAKYANESILPPTRYSKMLGIGGWVLGAFSAAYMALYADFGPHEHVFSPLRRRYHAFMKDLITLSPAERSVLGMDVPPRPAEPTSSGGLGDSLRDPTKKRPS